MNKQLILSLIKQAWYYIVAYFTQYLTPILKETLLKTKEYFINLLWDKLKEEFHLVAEPTVEYMEKYFGSLEYQQKEKDIMDTLFKNVKLPVLLRPFKGLIRKMLQDKLHNLIKSILEKVKAKL